VQGAGALIGARGQRGVNALRGQLIHAAALLLVAFCSPAWAQETCSAAFAQWVKLSESRIGKGSQGTCIPGEPQRQELLRALASVRGRCQTSTETDAEAEHVKMMIGVNEGFIGSVALCPSEAPRGEAAKSEKAHSPPQPRPRESDKALSAPQPRPRECLQIARKAVDRYAVINAQCSGRRVLAVVETQAPSGAIACKAYTVESSITVSGRAPLTLNFECRLDQKKCTRERVAAMFPECEW
jgi:hypothetical protein